MSSGDDSWRAPKFQDRHRPLRFDDLDFHHEIGARLKQMSQSATWTHMLFVGCAGSGKTTLVNTLLYETFGKRPDVARVVTKTYDVPSGTSESGNRFEIKLVGTDDFLMFSPLDVGKHDKSIIIHLVKELASAPPVSETSPFRVIVIENAEYLTTNAQHALRRTMEKHAAKCRIILVCQSIGPITAPLRSRCQAIRLSSPQNEQVKAKLTRVGLLEGFSTSCELLDNIVTVSQRNMTKALILLQRSVEGRLKLGPGILAEDDWERDIRAISTLILETQSPQSFMSIRDGLTNLLEAGIGASNILKEITIRISHMLSSKGRDASAIIRIAAASEPNLRKGKKDILHLSTFILEIMCELQDGVI